MVKALQKSLLVHMLLFGRVTSFTATCTTSTSIRGYASTPTTMKSTPSIYQNTKLHAFEPINLSYMASTLISEETQLQNTQIEQLSPETTVAVFIIGVIPFVWATIEFWRRIAVGASFGTGSDSVVIPRPDDDFITIGEDGNPESSRGRRTLDKGALTVAYVLFAVAAGSVGIALMSVLMGPRPDL